MDEFLGKSLELLFAAMLVAIVARRLALPYTVGLVVAGIGLAVAQVGTGALLTPGFIFDIVLPPLLFEAALNIHGQELRRDWLPVLTLSVAGVVVSAGCVAAGMAWGLGWPFVPAAIFGVLIAATDPVAVIAMFKDCGIGGRVRFLVECESLFNDGVTAVLFALVLAWADPASGGAGFGMAARILARSAGGGIEAGIVCGGVAILLAGRTSDHLVEAALTAVAAYGSFLLAQHFGASGVMATVVAGLLMGNLGVLGEPRANSLSSQGRVFVLEFWEFAAFIANSLVFLLIGLRVASVAFSGLGMVALAAVVGVVLLARAVAVYPICLLFRGGRAAISVREQHVLWWGGLRGALALALALALPAWVPMRDQIVVAAFGVVVFSVLVQGVTMPMLLTRLGFR